MASRSGSSHLDASGDREVVFCHQCDHEWYKDDQGLICPNCQGEATEIISPENDPRDLEDGPYSGFSHQHPHHIHDSDSDPDEADIDELTASGPGGFFGRSATYHNPGGPNARNRSRANPAAADDIIHRFQEMLGEIGGPRPVGRSGPEQLFPARNDGRSSPAVTFTRFSGPGFGGNVTTFSYNVSSGERTRSTMRSGPMGEGGDPFQQVFSNLFPQLGAPVMGRNGPNGPGGSDSPNSPDSPDGPGPGGIPANAPLNMLLQQLFSQIMAGPGAVHGDAVYSQEALDQIISQLMEQNPASNAPPPASAETIAKLPRKKLDEKMLGPELKGECTICIDDMSLGDEAVVLPCRHWFHDECVVLWLKEHNTCPICRTPIEGDASAPPDAAQSSAEGQASASSSAFRPEPLSERRRSNIRQRGSERLAGIQDNATSSSSSWRYTSRRNSDSPPQARSNPSRRDRSPSDSGRRSGNSERSRDSGSSSGGGLFTRLRDTFGRDRRQPDSH